MASRSSHCAWLEKHGSTSTHLRNNHRPRHVIRGKQMHNTQRSKRYVLRCTEAGRMLEKRQLAMRGGEASCKHRRHLPGHRIEILSERPLAQALLNLGHQHFNTRSQFRHGAGVFVQMGVHCGRPSSSFASGLNPRWHPIFDL